MPYNDPVNDAYGRALEERDRADATRASFVPMKPEDVPVKTQTTGELAKPLPTQMVNTAGRIFGGGLLDAMHGLNKTAQWISQKHLPNLEPYIAGLRERVGETPYSGGAGLVESLARGAVQFSPAMLAGGPVAAAGAAATLQAPEQNLGSLEYLSKLAGHPELAKSEGLQRLTNVIENELVGLGFKGGAAVAKSTARALAKWGTDLSSAWKQIEPMAKQELAAESAAVPGGTGNPEVQMWYKRHQEAHGYPDLTNTPPPPHSVELGKRIADEYEAMAHNPNDPAVKASYAALKNHIWEQYQGLEADGWKFNFSPTDTTGGDVAGILEKGKQKKIDVWTGGGVPADHPLAEVAPNGQSFNNVFRAVHDVVGHIMHGNGFGPEGEDAAWWYHAGTMSSKAMPAMTAETRGQNSWYNFAKHRQGAQGEILPEGAPGAGPYPEQKAGVMSPEAMTGRPMASAPATFLGPQKGENGETLFNLYNLTQDLPGHPAGSTVSDRTLRALGYEPPVPVYRAGKPTEGVSERLGSRWTTDPEHAKLYLTPDRVMLQRNVPAAEVRRLQGAPAAGALPNRIPDPFVHFPGGFPEPYAELPGQLHQALQEQGGFTANLGGLVKPAGGYAVSVHPDLAQTLESVTPEAIRDFITTHVGKLKDLNIGGWRDPETGRVTLDLSKVVPTLQEALALGRQHGQKAVYGFKEGQDFAVNGQLGEHAAQLEDMAGQRIREALAGEAGRFVPGAEIGGHLARDLMTYGTAAILRGRVKGKEAFQALMAKEFPGTEAASEDLWKAVGQNLDKLTRAGFNAAKATKAIEKFADTGKEGIGWYDRVLPELTDIFGPEDAKVITGFLAATSLNTSTPGNVELTRKAYNVWKQYGKIDPEAIQDALTEQGTLPGIDAGEKKGFMDTVIRNLDRVVRGEPITGKYGWKVQRFHEALMGDPNAVVLDRWMIRALWPEKIDAKGKISLTENQYKTVERFLQQKAQERGLTPRDLQAAIWVGIKKMQEGPESETRDFVALIKDQIAAGKEYMRQQQEYPDFNPREFAPEDFAMAGGQ